MGPVVSWSMLIEILVAQLNVYQLTWSVFVIILAIAFALVSLLTLLLPCRLFFPKRMRTFP